MMSHKLSFLIAIIIFAILRFHDSELVFLSLHLTNTLRPIFNCVYGFLIAGAIRFRWWARITSGMGFSENCLRCTHRLYNFMSLRSLELWNAPRPSRVLRNLFLKYQAIAFVVLGVCLDFRVWRGVFIYHASRWLMSLEQVLGILQQVSAGELIYSSMSLYFGD